MRLSLAALLFFSPLAAIAQTAPPAPPGRSITRAEFVQRAAEMAGRRFDAIDTNHTGSVTRGQIRAYREAHAGGRMPAAAE